MNSVTSYIVYSVTVAALLVLLLLSILAAFYFKKYLRRQKRPTFVKRPSQYTYITPNEPPKFVIPPYANFIDEDEFEEGEESGSDEVREEDENERESEPVLPIGGPTFPQLLRSVSAGPSTSPDCEERKSSHTGKRPQYRRAASSLGYPLVTRKITASRKISVSPYGKMQVSLQFVSSKNLLVIQVNGTYDLPQLRTSGVSTPYVRVRLLPGNGNKESRTSFMNLASNRICVFDRISLDEAKNATLKFVVLDYDKFSRSEFVAEVMIPLSEVKLEEGDTVTRHLNSQSRPDAGGERGILLLSLCQEPRAGHLGVLIIKADGLTASPNAELAPGLGTYVKVLYYVQNKLVDKKKTKVVKGTPCPIFNEPFIFEMKEEELKNSSVVCEVYQSDSKLKTDKLGLINLGIESFGTEIRHWNEMMSSPQKQVSEWHHLHM